MARLTDDQVAAVGGLVAELHAAAPEACAEATRKPYRWARQRDLHIRKAALVALDWRYLRRPSLETLTEILAALDLPVAMVDRLAMRYPEAIAIPRNTSRTDRPNSDV